MAELKNPLEFVRHRHVQILSLLLVLQGFGFYALSHGEDVPLSAPLTEMPKRLGTWEFLRDITIEERIVEKLKADEVLDRHFIDNQQGFSAGLMIAYFKSQRTGQSPHSPKNCLPGSGWVPESSGEAKIRIPSSGQELNVNRYIVTKGTQRTVVYYWYQSQGRVVASEYMAKLYLVVDAFRYNRTDTALVRITVPYNEGRESAADEAAVGFIREVIPILGRYLPGV